MAGEFLYLFSRVASVVGMIKQMSEDIPAEILYTSDVVMNILMNTGAEPRDKEVRKRIRELSDELVKEIEELTERHAKGFGEREKLAYKMSIVNTIFERILVKFAPKENLREAYVFV